MNHRNRLPVLAALFAVGATFAAQPLAADPSVLDKTIRDVRERWPAISHMSADELLQLRASGSAVVFDARTEEEYAVSHIDGAVRVDPYVSANDFAVKFAAKLKGKTAVFYCSVGVRSSKLAERVRGVIATAGGTGVANLDGGIFAWHRDQRPLIDARGETPKVHPYNSSWGKAVSRPGDISTEERK